MFQGVQLTLLLNEDNPSNLVRVLAFPKVPEQVEREGFHKAG